jgi:hypothetical protein
LDINGGKIFLITERNVPINGKNLPLLALHSSKSYLKKLDMIPNISEMVVMPHVSYEVDEWAINNDAQDFDYMNLKEIDYRNKLNNEIKSILPYFNLDINNYDEVLHRILEINSNLLILHNKGIRLHPVGIRQYLNKNLNWPTVSSKGFEEEIIKIQLGKDIL